MSVLKETQTPPIDISSKAITQVETKGCELLDKEDRPTTSDSLLAKEPCAPISKRYINSGQESRSKTPQFNFRAKAVFERRSALIRKAESYKKKKSNKERMLSLRSLNIGPENVCSSICDPRQQSHTVLQD
ncbi:7967_t:CDS:2 [Cetraspora pellucida]|uniref:7967_t:CDS:1 n=1 Tax=Cetraspora pellucida TaxID=1433469 RepID=A0ACA9KIH6_9GLOM|nr:7967_t:CDS:2 [Cetraspora pellucida]